MQASSSLRKQLQSRHALCPSVAAIAPHAVLAFITYKAELSEDSLRELRAAAERFVHMDAQTQSEQKLLASIRRRISKVRASGRNVLEVACGMYLHGHGIRTSRTFPMLVWLMPTASRRDCRSATLAALRRTGHVHTDACTVQARREVKLATKSRKKRPPPVKANQVKKKTKKTKPSQQLIAAEKELAAAELALADFVTDAAESAPGGDTSWSTMWDPGRCASTSAVHRADPGTTPSNPASAEQGTDLARYMAGTADAIADVASRQLADRHIANCARRAALALHPQAAPTDVGIAELPGAEAALQSAAAACAAGRPFWRERWIDALPEWQAQGMAALASRALELSAEANAAQRQHPLTLLDAGSRVKSGLRVARARHAVEPHVAYPVLSAVLDVRTAVLGPPPTLGTASDMGFAGQQPSGVLNSIMMMAGDPGGVTASKRRKPNTKSVKTAQRSVAGKRSGGHVKTALQEAAA